MEYPPKKMPVVERPGRCGEVAVSGGCLFTVIQALLLLLYGHVSKRLETNKLKNLIG